MFLGLRARAPSLPVARFTEHLRGGPHDLRLRCDAEEAGRSFIAREGPGRARGAGEHQGDAEQQPGAPPQARAVRRGSHLRDHVSHSRAARARSSVSRGTGAVRTSCQPSPAASAVALLIAARRIVDRVVRRYQLRKPASRSRRVHDCGLSLQCLRGRHVGLLVRAVDCDRRDRPPGSRGLTPILAAKMKQPRIGRDFGEQFVDPAIAHRRNAEPGNASCDGRTLADSMHGKSAEDRRAARRPFAPCLRW